MWKQKAVYAVPVFLFVAILILPHRAFSDEPNRAGLVVQFEDGQVETRCITFEGDQITGADLLDRSGLQVIVDASSGMGITVCQIDREGCPYPSEPCFCQCMGGGECAYWNYFYREPGEAGWIYSALGVALRKVKPGSVEAWVWGDGRTLPADGLAFETICPTPTDTPIPPTPLPATATTAPSPIPPSVQPPTRPPDISAASPSPTIVTPSSPASGSGPDLSSYWPFGLMVLALAAVGAAIWLRRT